MILLDTNVVSELFKPDPDAGVAAFLDRHAVAGFWIASVTLLELRYGVQSMPEGRRKRARVAALDDFLTGLIGDKVLGFGADEVPHCVRALRGRRGIGRSLDDHMPDVMIAAAALSNGLPLATRNVSDFEGLGLTLIDPWTAGAP